MEVFAPSNHTKLINLAIMLGSGNEIIESRLLNHDYPIKNLALRIPVPGFNIKIKNPAAVPDCGYSSAGKNSVLFIEVKGGGTDDNQLDRFQHVQDNPKTLLATRNNLDITEKDLKIDFAILGTELNKLREDHERNSIGFPILYYDQEAKQVRRENFNSTNFKNSEFDAIFSNPINVPKLPIIFLPFGASDFESSFGYVLQNILLLIIENNLSQKKYGRMPSLEQMIIERFPILKMMGDQEFQELVKVIEKSLKKVFPDTNSTGYNPRKYLSIKKGKVYVKRTTLKKFLDKINSELSDLETRTRQTTLESYTSSESNNEIIFGVNISQFFENIDADL